MKLFILIVIALFTLGCGQGPTEIKGPTNSPSPAAHSESDHAHEDEDHGTHKEEGHDEHEEGEEGFVTPTKAQQQEIGIKVEGVVTANLVGAVRTGRVEPDPDRSIMVSPQVSGTVRHLPILIGSQVRKGDVLAVIDSPEIAVLKGEYHNAQVEVDLAMKELRNKEALFKLGDESRREVEESKLQLAEANARHDAAKARLQSAKLAHERLAKLRQEGIASAQQVEEALAQRQALEADLREASTAISIAKQHLERESRIANSDLRRKAETFPADASLARARENQKHIEERLLQLGADLGEGGTITLSSPIDGQVIKRPVNRGQMINVGEAIAELVDPTQVWVIVDLTKDDLALVSVGDETTVSLVGDAKVSARGTISYINPLVNSESQTVGARIELREPGGKFRVGSFINATLAGHTALPTLPKEAIQDVEGVTVVYRVDGDGFRRTPVEIVAQNAEKVSLKGLPKGSQVVTKGATDLKSLDLAGSIGGHSH